VRKAAAVDRGGRRRLTGLALRGMLEAR
jgi:hypothetical protein